jgi:hypothetical protein
LTLTASNHANKQDNSRQHVVWLYRGLTQPVFWAVCMAGQQSRRDRQLSIFGYVVEHFYFYRQKDWPGGTSYEYRGYANAFTLHAILIH